MLRRKGINRQNKEIIAEGNCMPLNRIEKKNIQNVRDMLILGKKVSVSECKFQLRWNLIKSSMVSETLQWETYAKQIRPFYY